MNYVRLIGGLGNQLFQYSFAYYLYKKKKKIKLDATIYQHYRLHNLLLKKFKIELNFAHPKEIKKYYFLGNQKLSFKLMMFSRKIYNFLTKYFNKSKIYIENSNSKISGNNYLYDGYWQNFKFLDENKSELLKQIKPKKTRYLHKKLLKKISLQKNSVAIHVRIYRDKKRELKFHGNISKDYITKAMKIIEKKIAKPSYFIFSNSNNWFEENINLQKRNITFVSGYKDYEDLISISKCKHQIISNSTFGWWGSWLNTYKKKIILVPNKWFKSKKRPRNLIPKEWISI